MTGWWLTRRGPRGPCGGGGDNRKLGRCVFAHFAAVFGAEVCGGLRGLTTDAGALVMDRSTAVQVFTDLDLLPEEGAGNVAGRVVDAAQESEPGTVWAEPLVAAAVGLQQHPSLWHPLAA